MKTRTLTLFLALIIIGTTAFAQKSTSSERYGRTLNQGLGVGGYYGYYHHGVRSMPVINFI